jgi:hypothetical protein
MLRLLFFVAVIASACIFDYYNSDNAIELNDKESINHPVSQKSNIEGIAFLVSGYTCQNPGVKTTFKKIQDSEHDRYIRKFHQLRHFQMFKDETKITNIPDFHQFHKLLLRHKQPSLPDDIYHS